MDKLGHHVAATMPKSYVLVLSYVLNLFIDNMAAMKTFQPWHVCTEYSNNGGSPPKGLATAAKRSALFSLLLSSESG
jgi:hypothetical protein